MRYRRKSEEWREKKSDQGGIESLTSSLSASISSKKSDQGGIESDFLLASTLLLSGMKKSDQGGIERLQRLAGIDDKREEIRPRWD